MNYWIITDTHFGHKKLIEYGRPSDFEQKLKRNISLNVTKDDMIIHLGDVCIGDDSVHNNWFANKGFRRVLVLGNHDHRGNEWYLKNGWDFVCKRFNIKVFGKRICFTHVPVIWDGYSDINIHGHFHDTDHRIYDPEFNNILSDYNKLLAVEHTNYSPVNLEKFINN